ncbi:MAG: hypothetical protein B7X53_12020 [Hyphomonas sp. 34-62-18]|nr:hypothetical protein [Hyphomonas sp. 34-62-18]OYW86713.1 MAG: hypothetical protein B7Z22_06090 [Hyphomonas sp. 32-62-5]OZB15209.1 MAG: hypothetical protein B7X53_12020 [Hyphomonas sp. 34-62-18]
MRGAIAVVMLALCAACGTAPVAVVPGSGTPVPACHPYQGFEVIAEKAESHIVVFGEAIHGTNESPAALFGLACHLAKEGAPVLVGLEAERTFSDELDAFLDHGDAVRLYGTTSGMWDVHDGRSSQAILLLLQNLAELRAAGLEVSVFAFDASSELDYREQADWGTVSRDARMAETVDAAAARFSGAVLLLTGGFHARKQVFDFDGTSFVPMATGIQARPVFSLEMRHAGGSGWMIGEVDGKPFMGALDLMNGLPPDAPVHAFALGAEEPAYDGNTAYWDGVYYTGPITASPPAFPSRPPS